MEKWLAVIQKFAAHWRNQSHVVGMMVCGSYVTGNPSPRSDLDVHIILSDDTTWRERGNRFIDGFHIEYFANPPAQIRAYFAQDYQNRLTMSMIQFLTGYIVFDTYGMIETLKQEAKQWKEKGVLPLNPALIELKKYHLYDLLDNVLDAFEQNQAEAMFIYHCAIQKVFQEYSLMIGNEQIPMHQMVRYLTDEKYLSKYLKLAFPDRIFAEYFLACIKSDDKERMIISLEQLITHVFQQTGGFEVNGWKFQSEIQT